MRLKMKFTIPVLLILVNNVISMFYHEPSFIEIKPKEETAEMDFGFSMGYQHNRRLVIGAPHSDLKGQVYTCSIEEVMKNNSVCNKAEIDVENLASEFTREPNPKQSYCLGASIAATSDYFLTCAPLWMSSYKKKYPNKFADMLSNSIGTCFVYNGTAFRYEGLYEQHLKMSISNRNAFFGGVGWTTLVDESNQLILISKLMVQGDISYISMRNPLEPASSILNGHTYLSHSEYNTGYALASGYFSESGVNKTIYAYSTQTKNMTGKIQFLKYQKDENKLILVKRSKIIDDSINAMFGTTMLGVDLNFDGYSELIVGAPTQSDDEENYETGALHIYTGGSLEGINKMDRKRLILGTKVGSRFGSAIAATDVDGDNFPEIIVSAPYENFGLGAVYVISGFEVNEVLLKQKHFKSITLSELLHTQIIRNADFKSFGFSLQVLADVDDNGGDELAVGCPQSKRAILYRSIPSIMVSVTTGLVGEQVVRIKDNNFKVRILVNITYPPKPTKITGQLKIINRITGSGLQIRNHKDFVIDLSRKESKNEFNADVDIKNNEPGTYEFNTLVELDNDAKFKSKDFDPTKVALCPLSQTKSEPLYIERRCSGESCLAQLSMALKWSGSDPYQLGSTRLETITMRVKNVGNTSYAQACAYLRVRGAQVERTSCDNTPLGYKCLLDIPIRRDSVQLIEVPLDMSKPTNMDKELFVEVDFYNSSCSQETNFQRISHSVPFKMESDVITVNGSSHNRNFTDSEVLDKEQNTFKDMHEYSIENKGVTLWNDINAVVVIHRQPFIEDYKISTTFTANDCDRQNTEDAVFFKCILNLEPLSVVKVIVTTILSKENVVKSMIDDKVNISSSLVLHLTPTKEKEENMLTTIIKYRKVLSVGQNKNLIILIAIIVAFIILAVLIFILYKFGFFRRNTKEKLIEEKKQDERRKSLKISESTRREDNNDPQMNKEPEDFELEVLE